MLRGVGYESNDASVLTNVSSDHMDLHGIHTLPELAEVKSIICRITRPDGRGGPQRRRRPGGGDGAPCPRAGLLFSMRATSRAGPAPPGRAVARPASWRRAGWWSATATARRPIVAVDGGARHAPRPGASQHRQRARRGGRRARAGRHAATQVADGLRTFAPDGRAGARTAEPVPARRDRRHRRLRPQRGGRGGRAGRRARGSSATARRAPGGGSLAIIVGTAGDRPDDTLRGIGRIAARARRPGGHQGDARTTSAGRTRESVVGELRAGIDGGGGSGRTTTVYEDEPSAVRGELGRRRPARGDRPAGRAGRHVPRGSAGRRRHARRAGFHAAVARTTSTAMRSIARRAGVGPGRPDSAVCSARRRPPTWWPTWIERPVGRPARRSNTSGDGRPARSRARSSHRIDRGSSQAAWKAMAAGPRRGCRLLSAR